MEDADVNQLISLIESAQLQYEVDESGTVSIVCDPVKVMSIFVYEYATAKDKFACNKKLTLISTRKKLIDKTSDL